MILFLIFINILVAYHIQATEVTTDSPATQYDYLCQPWYNYNPFDGSCTCTSHKIHHSSRYKIECGQLGAIITQGYCTTYEEGTGTLISQCLYFKPKGLNLTSDGYTLPHNISELNDYMCGPMHRMNRLCSDCIDGYGPSFTSFRFECSNCIGVWYGVPLYLLVELGPLTLLYLVIIIFHISMTSAPLTVYIMYSQLILAEIIFGRTSPVTSIVANESNTIGVKVIVALYGVWNLDPIRFLVPPFCISARLKTIHIALLGYVSAFYPLCLIFLTWICAELHGRNFKLLVLCWRPIHRVIVRLRHGLYLKTDLISVFASFFTLVYNKLLYLSVLLLSCQDITTKSLREFKSRQVTVIDPSTECWSTQHFMVAIPVVFILLFCVMFPSVLFLLYSTRAFRACLTKCRVSGPYLAIINIFMEKYYSCCRDGLNGGRDMRAFAGFYFILRVIAALYSFPLLGWLSISFWTYQTIVLSSAALVIALVKPYKETYMNVLDALQLALIALLCHLLSQEYILDNSIQLLVLCILPAAGFILYNILTRTQRLRRLVFKFFKKSCRKPGMYNHITDDAPLIVTSTTVTVETANYQSTNK